MLAEYRPPTRQWNEVLPIDLVPCPECDATNMEKVGVQEGGAYLLMQCRRCDLVSKVSG